MLLQTYCDFSGYPHRKDLQMVTVIKGGYFDESGKFHDHKVIAFCGFVSDMSDWYALQIEWYRLCRQYGIPGLHMSDGVLNFKRPFSSKRHVLGKAQRIEAIQKFIRVIKANIEFAITVAIDVDAFMSLSDRHKDVVGGNDPYYFSFSAAMSAVLLYIKTTPNTKVTIVCDEEEKYFIKCFQLLSRFKRERVDIRNTFSAISAADDKEYPQMQAADLLACITRNEAAHRFLGIPYDFRELFEEFGAPQENQKLAFSPAGIFWGKKRLTEYAEHTIAQRRKKREP